MITESSTIGHVSTRSTRYFHLFSRWDNKSGGLCIAISRAEEVAGEYVRNIQFARCRKGDQYNKATARKIVLERLQKERIQFIFHGADWYLVSSFITSELNRIQYDYDAYGKLWQDRGRTMRALLSQQ